MEYNEMAAEGSPKSQPENYRTKADKKSVATWSSVYISYPTI